MATRLHNNSEYADLIRSALKAGGHFRPSKGHKILVLPSCRIISMSRSASDWRAERNGINLLRKVLVEDGIIKRGG